MVLVATGRDTGKAQALGVTNAKDCQSLSPKFARSKASQFACAKKETMPCRSSESIGDFGPWVGGLPFDVVHDYGPDATIYWRRGDTAD